MSQAKPQPLLLVKVNVDRRHVVVLKMQQRSHFRTFLQIRRIEALLPTRIDVQGIL